MLAKKHHTFFSIQKRSIVAFSILAAMFLFLSFFSPDITFAQEDVLGVNQVEDTIALSGLDIRSIIARIINVVLGFIAVIMVSLMVYGGFLWMTSAGNEEQVTKAKRVITNAVVGFIIVAASFAITSFLLDRIGRATGVIQGDGNGAARRPIAAFEASGSLGRSIRDHYPFRNETNVKRNTKIVVTFTDAINPETVIENVNGSCWTEAGQPTVDQGICDPDGDGTFDRPEYFGDCAEVGGQQVCDEIIQDSVEIFATSNEAELVDAFAYTTYDADALATTFVFDPKENLGSDEQAVQYTVRLTSDIALQTGGSVFAGDRDGAYRWNFETGTEIDVDPPVVVSIYPERGSVVPRNSIVKIQFSEAIDPTSAQGLQGPDSPFSHLLLDAGIDLEGEWKLSSGYTVAEFVSNDNCGQNSCGEPMYCLPVNENCAEGDAACQTNYAALARTAVQREAGPRAFDALIFTGIMDVSGNRLDGNADGEAQEKPRVGDPKEISEGEDAPDNFFWNFTVNNTIDQTPPYIQSVLPSLDQQNVDRDAPLEVQFSTRMWNATLYNIDIVEHPEEEVEAIGLAQIWKRPIGEDQNNATRAIVNHREFGPQDTSFYYFTAVPGSVKSVTQNCLYPGVGPVYQELNQIGNLPECVAEYDERGVLVIAGENCIPVDAADSENDTGCAQLAERDKDELTQASLEACINYLSDPVISPRANQ